MHAKGEGTGEDVVGEGSEELVQDVEVDLRETKVGVVESLGETIARLNLGGIPGQPERNEGDLVSMNEVPDATGNLVAILLHATHQQYHHSWPAITAPTNRTTSKVRPPDDESILDASKFPESARTLDFSRGERNLISRT